jgi:hypothetical protein
MAPGMMERERLAVERQRLAWLSEAMNCAGRQFCACPNPALTWQASPVMPRVGLWRPGLFSTRTSEQCPGAAKGLVLSDV